MNTKELLLKQAADEKVSKQDEQSLFDTFEEKRKEFNDLFKEYEIAKLELETSKIELKYSDDFQQYKTIKEKEERAVLSTKELKIALIETKNKLEDLQLQCEMLKLQIDLHYFS